MGVKTEGMSDRMSRGIRDLVSEFEITGMGYMLGNINSRLMPTYRALEKRGLIERRMADSIAYGQPCKVQEYIPTQAAIEFIGGAR